MSRRSNKGVAYPSGYGNPEVRFWKRVNKHGPIHPKVGQCWIWVGKLFQGKGYGQFGIIGRTVRAHRFSWELRFGPVPEGLCVLHQCDNPGCVNPNHLFLGTNKDNTADMDRKGRRNSRRVLTLAQVKQIQLRYKRYSRENGSYRLAEDYGVSQTAIWTALGKR